MTDKYIKQCYALRCAIEQCVEKNGKHELESAHALLDVWFNVEYAKQERAKRIAECDELNKKIEAAGTQPEGGMISTAHGQLPKAPTPPLPGPPPVPARARLTHCGNSDATIHDVNNRRVAGIILRGRNAAEWDGMGDELRKLTLTDFIKEWYDEQP